MVTPCVNRFKRYKIVHSAHGRFVCFVWVSKQTAIIFLEIIDRMTFYNRDEMYFLRCTNWIFKCNYLFIYLAGCSTFPHLPAPI